MDTVSSLFCIVASAKFKKRFRSVKDKSSSCNLIRQWSDPLPKRLCLRQLKKKGHLLVVNYNKVQKSCEVRLCDSSDLMLTDALNTTVYTGTSLKTSGKDKKETDSLNINLYIFIAFITLIYIYSI